MQQQVVTRMEAPTGVEAVQTLVASAIENRWRIEVVGGGTKRSIGAVAKPDVMLSLAAMDAVVDYAPEELVLTVQPGATLTDLERLTAQQGQMLAFEPPHLTGVLGRPGHPTIGGALATNLSGPRRVRAGAARDHFLGFEAVNGRGEIFKAGGKVVKNVTGYDLSKLMAGSWGTLAVMTEVTLKVLPAPRAEVTLMIFGLDDRRAGEAMSRAMNAPAEVSAAAHLPPFASRCPPLGAEMSVTALRLDGFEASVAARAEALSAALREFGRVERLDAHHSREFWVSVREVECFAADPRPLWRLSVPPASGWRVAEALAGDLLYDWAGGLVWLLPEPTAAPALVRDAARALGGHATLFRGDGPAFERLQGPLDAVSRRVKAAFDPNGVLNPGRLAGEA
jgi:glycolate oxidase FAD binding subunit